MMPSSDLHHLSRTRRTRLDWAVEPAVPTHFRDGKSRGGVCSSFGPEEDAVWGSSTPVLDREYLHRQRVYPTAGVLLPYRLNRCWLLQRLERLHGDADRLLTSLGPSRAEHY